MSTIRSTTRPHIDWQPIAVAVALLLAFVFLFHRGLAHLWERWGSQQELSHAYFIPLVTFWMLWERRDALRQSMGRPHWLGMLLAGVSVLLVLSSETTHIFFLAYVSIFLSAFAVSLLVGGISLTRVAFFPLVYLVFMIPPPVWIITVTSWQFQIWSSELGVAMIRMFGVPVYLSGNVIDLGVIKLQVAEACSGLRYLFPFLSLGALAAYFYRGPSWQRAIILLSTIPITILVNSFRIAVTGVLSSGGDVSHTEGVLHFFEGWVVFGLCIAILLGIIVLFGRTSGRRNVVSTLGLPECEPTKPAEPWSRRRFMILAGGVAVAVTLLSIVIHSTEHRAFVPERKGFATLPLEFPGWRVQELPLDVATEQVLGADDYIVLDLVSPEGERFNLYIAYLEAQRDGRSWHSPRQCLPGGGWEFEVQQIIPAGPANPLGHPYNRILMKSGDDRYLVYYWYDQRGRAFADEIWMKIVLIWDVATQQRSDGAMVRLMTPVGPEEDVADADARLIKLRDRLRDILPAYVPD
ncbi:eight transmembrane protein EpsH, putative exosortase [Thioflavicoccus mobilis 8321]|uniref:Eight transmembrane protein EpsH, putative exosortase n=1 Tax=Thioflavicoccus mobilis 8321 TaxID=765912 RepID=L0H2E8_9GAMM|nr:VPLPA-CTERM-specific exosortase XrtD [Thioflavicoccus mobilis]AGA91764.1 eight transmembrane protein EpsH, putative exosortase [Thioflavicoccus mobilis 8321]